MKTKLQNLVFSIFLVLSCTLFGQDVGLYTQYNGKVDFTFIGNTMNLAENNSAQDSCSVLTSSTADLELEVDDQIISAFLYWAGSGTGDLEVLLNRNIIIPSRTFSQTLPSTGLPFFSAFADVTKIVLAQGNGTYRLSEFDISDVISETDYCNNGTNFAGWAIVITYKNESLPNNQINIYDGLQRVPTVLDISLSSINVVDTIGAKIGFVAWEGDQGLAVGETLRFNGNIISNPPLNPENNTFNGTNSITGNATLYNMDLDIYDIQNNIQVGDQEASINLTSGQDFVMINVVVTKLNNEAPDATITIDSISGLSCNSRLVTLDYTVRNFDSFEALPAGTPIAIYAGTTLVAQTQTNSIIPIGGTESGQIILTIPDFIPQNFELRMQVDDLGNGDGVQSEITETNNSDVITISLLQSPQFAILPNLFFCVSEVTAVSFDFSSYETEIKINPTDIVHFYTSFEEATLAQNPILNSSDYIVNIAQTTIYIRLENANCFSVTSFKLLLIFYPEIKLLNPLKTCRIDQTTTFNFSEYASEVLINPTDTVSFFETFENADTETAVIFNFSNYLPPSTPKKIYVRVDNGFCHTITEFTIDYYELPKFNSLPTLISCNEGLTKGTFDFINYDDLVKVNPLDTVTFYENLQDAENQNSPIITPSKYVAQTTPKEIFVRIENSNNCISITSFFLTTKNCPPTVYNFVSANNDSLNPVFYVEGLRDIFLNFKIEIYNRWGKLVWTGNNSTEDWNGISNQEIRFENNSFVPMGTYYYVLNLNDSNYPNPIIGYLYLSRKNP